MSSNADNIQDGKHVKSDGTPDMRYKENRDDSTVDESSSAGEGQGKPAGQGTGTNEHGEEVPLTKSGEPDKRYSSKHGFGGDREEASRQGQKGGKTGNNDDDDE
ncbi:hypothetical protein EMMF5_003423 [Cystobasidiomycetes sp. EMM_F5]